MKPQTSLYFVKNELKPTRGWIHLLVRSTHSYMAYFQKDKAEFHISVAPTRWAPYKLFHPIDNGFSVAHLAFTLGTNTLILVQTNLKLSHCRRFPRFLDFEGLWIISHIFRAQKFLDFSWVVGVQGIFVDLTKINCGGPAYEVPRSIVTNGVIHGAAKINRLHWGHGGPYK